jgi:hypothetical protein
MLKKIIHNSLNGKYGDHISHLFRGVRSIRHDFERNEKNIFKRFCVRTLSGYLPRLFLYSKKNTLIDQKLKKNGFSEVASLDTDLVNKLIKKFVDFASKEYSLEFENLNHVIKFLEKKDIQQSKKLHLTNTSDLIKLLFETSNLIKISEDYLNEKKEDLRFMVRIFALAKTQKEDKFRDSYNALEFHRDFDHFKFIKFFYYLTDCFEGNGHHEYILNSHKGMNFSLAPNKRFTLSQILQKLKTSELKKVMGKAGTGFAEDTFGFHRGTLVKKDFRLMMLILVKPSGCFTDETEFTLN